MKFAIALVLCFAALYCDATTPSYPDLRNQYDRTLMELSKEKARQAEELLLRLTPQFNGLTCDG